MKTNYRKLVNLTINAINESNDCIWLLSSDTFLGEKRLCFEMEECKGLNHSLTFSSWSDMYIYLRGFQGGANSLKPF